MAKTTKKKKGLPDNMLSDTIDKEADEKARQNILRARIAMVLRHGMFGQLAMRLQLVNADSWLETAATDGRHFYYNSRFINMLNPQQNIFLFMHELLHCAYDHMERGRNKHQKLGNIAMDYVVNADCIKYNMGSKITQVPLLYDKKYEDWSFEQVYDDLMKNVKTIDMDELMDMLLDDHLEDDKQGKDKKNGRPQLSDEEKKQIRDEFREALLSAAQAAGAGNAPANLARQISALTNPKINWREMITQQIQSIVKNDYTWATPNKKHFSQGFVLPNMRKDEAIEVCVAVDTSGSIGEKQLNAFFSEIAGIMDSYDEYNIKVWCFDTSVHNPQDYDTGNGHDLVNYQPKGFGGTDFDVNWEWMKNEQVEPKLLIVFTDGEPYGSWGDENYCDTVWIINNQRNKTIVPPFGVSAYYED
jgi:predicted metal-dependent peptidase